MPHKIICMRKHLLCLLALVCIHFSTYAGKDKDSSGVITDEYAKYVDSLNATFHWQNDKVTIAHGVAELNLGQHYKYLDADESQVVLHDLWGNPPRTDVLGMIFPVNSGPLDSASYAFIITYDEDGYVKDDEADKIDYNQMLRDIHDGEKEANEERMKEGYQPIHMVGWAQSPFYDKQLKVLHWAKELEFGGDSSHTLNYEVRVLGRKGILSLNAVAGMNELPLVNANIADVLKIASFTAGNRYADFNSNTDKVAEYGIGALVAGGLLAKTGFFTMIGKFLLAAWKFILIGIAAIAGAVRKFFNRSSRKETYQEPVIDYKPLE